MTYRIQGLKPGQFTRFFASDEAALARSLTHNAKHGCFAARIERYDGANHD
jgi:hypothetical protein